MDDLEVRHWLELAAPTHLIWTNNRFEILHKNRSCYANEAPRWNSSLPDIYFFRNKILYLDQ